MPVSGLITNIARGSLHDGPGVRTVVYFKGCGLRCKWCHNPEALSGRKQVLYTQRKCIHCGSCAVVCPEHHQINGKDMRFVRKGCTACGRCAEACPALALSLCGEEYTVESLMDVIGKDRHFYDASGGGVTFSGGECLLQSSFLLATARKCKEQGIHTAVESALFVPWQNVEQVIPYVDLFYADLKIPDPEKHRAYTGQDNSRILENINNLSQCAKRMILRIPVIPGVNDGKEDLEGFARIIRPLEQRVAAVELLKYNPLAETKYEICGAVYSCFGREPQPDAQMRELCDILTKKSGKHCFFA